MFFFLMLRRPPRATRTDTLFPYTTLFRSRLEIEDSQAGMHFVAWLAGRSDAEAAALFEHARRARLGLYATTPLHLRPHDRVGLVMGRSEEHTSELQSLMRISYAVFCLKKKKHKNRSQKTQHNKEQEE